MEDSPPRDAETPPERASLSSFADAKKLFGKAKSLPKYFGQYDTFYSSLRDSEMEQRRRQSDSMERLRRSDYRGEGFGARRRRRSLRDDAAYLSARSEEPNEGAGALVEEDFVEPAVLFPPSPPPKNADRSPSVMPCPPGVEDEPRSDHEVVLTDPCSTSSQEGATTSTSVQPITSLTALSESLMEVSLQSPEAHPRTCFVSSTAQGDIDGSLAPTASSPVSMDICHGEPQSVGKKLTTSEEGDCAGSPPSGCSAEGDATENSPHLDPNWPCAESATCQEKGEREAAPTVVAPRDVAVREPPLDITPDQEARQGSQVLLGAEKATTDPSQPSSSAQENSISERHSNSLPPDEAWNQVSMASMGGVKEFAFPLTEHTSTGSAVASDDKIIVYEKPAPCQERSAPGGNASGTKDTAVKSHDDECSPAPSVSCPASTLNRYVSLPFVAAQDGNVGMAISLKNHEIIGEVNVSSLSATQENSIPQQSPLLDPGFSLPDEKSSQVSVPKAGIREDCAVPSVEHADTGLATTSNAKVIVHEQPALCLKSSTSKIENGRDIAQETKEETLVTSEDPVGKGTVVKSHGDGWSPGPPLICPSSSLNGDSSQCFVAKQDENADMAASSEDSASSKEVDVCERATITNIPVGNEGTNTSHTKHKLIETKDNFNRLEAKEDTGNNTNILQAFDSCDSNRESLVPVSATASEVVTKPNIPFDNKNTAMSDKDYPKAIGIECSRSRYLGAKETARGSNKTATLQSHQSPGGDGLARNTGKETRFKRKITHGGNSYLKRLKLDASLNNSKYAKRTGEVLRCTNKFCKLDPLAHSLPAPCEWCWTVASPQERKDFVAYGRHLRIAVVRSGCPPSCTLLPYFRGAGASEGDVCEDEAIRLCRRCYGDIHHVGIRSYSR